MKNIISDIRRQREKLKNIRNIRTTTAIPSLAPEISTAASYLTSVTTPVVIRRQSLQWKYNSAEANYLALRGNNNYKARQYSSTTTSPGISKLKTVYLISDSDS